MIEHCIAQYHYSDQLLPMATGPKKQDYFVLYNSIAKDMGFLDYEFAGKATAFYLLLKGSRDTAESFDFLREAMNAKPPRIDEDVFKVLIAESSKCVLEMLEDVFRNGFLAATIARKIDETPPRLLWLERVGIKLKLSRDQFASKEIKDTAQRYYEIFQTWILLVAINSIILKREKRDNPTFHTLADHIYEKLQQKKGYILKTIADNNAFVTFISIINIAKEQDDNDHDRIVDEILRETANHWAERLMFQI